MKKLMTATVLAAGLVGGAASAAVVETTFTLSGNSSPSNGFSLSSGGLTAGVTGKSVSSIGLNGTSITSVNGLANEKVGRYSEGAGVTSYWGDDHTVDGNVTNDLIQLVFSSAVQIVSASFGYFDWRDDFRYMVDTDGNGFDSGDYISAEMDVVSPFTNFANLSSKTWAFAAFGDNDSWKLKSVTVRYDDGISIDPDPVPLPASGLLLLGGLGALVMRRRKAA